MKRRSLSLMLPRALPPEHRALLAGDLGTGATGRFGGYASLFGKADLAGDVVMPGAFAASLKRRGTGGVKLLYQHDPCEPIGRWLSLFEDGTGLRAEGEIHAGIVRGREVSSLIRAGILDGLSIGFRAVRAEKDPRTGLRRLLEIDLWEISLVTFPMQPGARLSASASLPRAGQSRPGSLAGTIRRAARRIAPA
ncbi:HK97 family phage prohead protease [Methylobrevis pamukkalensis]|uniref:Caudovirus prohead protease n=1 Tax=Methylobrevis pamukkalensis TaxID=1439726 RepID=A0A1E3H7W9_9HYPH|nr:HK97 family phage prohead protease [Methylobrevis pamukkalensis]ODN72427.1 Caudovirus prohead protease [Methylobrevis pamukkalensis]